MRLIEGVAVSDWQDCDDEAGRLYATWRDALTRLRSCDTQANAEVEQRAYDELVDYVEARDLNETGWDPR